MSTNISLMCQTIIRGPAATLIKKLAYDVVHAAPLSDSDWSLVIEGLRSDIVGTFSLEVRRAAWQPSNISVMSAAWQNRASVRGQASAEPPLRNLDA